MINKIVEYIPRNNTIKFVCEIDRKWNVMHRVEKSTERDFIYPPGFE